MNDEEIIVIVEKKRRCVLGIPRILLFPQTQSILTVLVHSFQSAFIEYHGLLSFIIISNKRANKFAKIKHRWKIEKGST